MADGMDHFSRALDDYYNHWILDSGDSDTGNSEACNVVGCSTSALVKHSMSPAKFGHTSGN